MGSTNDTLTAAKTPVTMVTPEPIKAKIKGLSFSDATSLIGGFDIIFTFEKEVEVEVFKGCGKEVCRIHYLA